MKTLAKVFGVISLVCLFLAGVGIIIYYVVEFISSFLVSTIDMVETGDTIWKIIYICFGGSVGSFLLSYFIDKR